MKCKCGRIANWYLTKTWFGDPLQRIYYCPKCKLTIKECNCGTINNLFQIGNDGKSKALIESEKVNNMENENIFETKEFRRFSVLNFAALSGIFYQTHGRDPKQCRLPELKKKELVKSLEIAMGHKLLQDLNELWDIEIIVDNKIDEVIFQ